MLCTWSGFMSHIAKYEVQMVSTGYEACPQEPGAKGPWCRGWATAQANPMCQFENDKFFSTAGKNRVVLRLFHYCGLPID